MIKAVQSWLKEYKQSIKNDPDLSSQIDLYIKQYEFIKKQLAEKIKTYPEVGEYDVKIDLTNETVLTAQFLEIERAVLQCLWKQDKISYAVKSKLLEELDFRANQFRRNSPRVKNYVGFFYRFQKN